MNRNARLHGMPGARVLLLYLRLFAWFASDREHALSEHMLIHWSIEECRADYVDAGASGGRALLRALWAHRGELQPFALFWKTASDQRFAPGGPGHVRRGILFMTGAVALGLAAVSVPVVLAADEPPHLVARAVPEGADASDEDLHVRGFARFRDALASVGLSPADLRADRSDSEPPAVSTPDPRPLVEEPLDHCVIRVGRQHGEGHASEASEPRCFPTFADALGSATGVEVSLKLDRPRDTDEIVSALEPVAGSALIGVSFSRAWFAGGTLIWVATAPDGCRVGASYAVPELPARWEGAIASALALGGCETFAHFELVDFAGAQLNCTCDGMRAMHRQTSSLHWSR